MNIEDVRLECVSCHPAVEETFPFDDTNLVMKIGGKMFALLPLDNPDTISLKSVVTLLYASRDRGRNNATVIYETLTAPALQTE